MKHCDPYFAEWKYFMECLENYKKVENATFDDGRRALEVALASIGAAGKKTVIKLQN